MKTILMVLAVAIATPTAAFAADAPKCECGCCKDMKDDCACCDKDSKPADQHDMKH